MRPARQHLSPCLRLRSNPYSPGAAGPDMIQQLKDLAELKDQGVLTDEEFAAQKSRILGT
jgi:hypothetical protein